MRYHSHNILCIIKRIIGSILYIVKLNIQSSKTFHWSLKRLIAASLYLVKKKSKAHKYFNDHLKNHWNEFISCWKSSQTYDFSIIRYQLTFLRLFNSIYKTRFPSASGMVTRCLSDLSWNVVSKNMFYGAAIRTIIA